MIPPQAIGPAVGAGLGIAKWFNDRQNEFKDKKQLALWTALAPYMALGNYKLDAPNVRNSDFMGTVGGAGLAGFELGQKNPNVMTALSALGKTQAPNSVEALPANAGAPADDGTPAGPVKTPSALDKLLALNYLGGSRQYG
jgi:hypothetical protein